MTEHTFIIDLEGRKITITDLDGSIAMVAGFLDYHKRHAIPSLNRLESRRREYWLDLHKKLLHLKSELNKLH